MAELMFYRISCLFTKDGLAHPDLPSLTCMRSHSPMESVVRRGRVAACLRVFDAAHARMIPIRRSLCSSRSITMAHEGAVSTRWNSSKLILLSPSMSISFIRALVRQQRSDGHS
jgi:hypothetical protein